MILAITGVGNIGAAMVRAAPATIGTHATTPTPKKVGQIPKPFVSGHAGSYAWGAATMPDGSLIIGDIWNRRVLHYDTSGNLLGVLFTLPQGDAPYGIAVDKRNGAVYVGRPFPTNVGRWVPNSQGMYSPQGVLHAPGMLYPSRVAVANDGTVYIADQYAHMIWVFNGDSGQLLFQFGGRGSAPGQFNFPRGLAVDASFPQRLFVMDSGNERVQVFTLSTGSATFSFAFGSNGQGPGQFHGENTRGLAIDTTDGWVFVSDIGANTVHKFDLAGTWLQNIGHLDRSTFPSPAGTFVQGGREVAVTTGTDGRRQLWVGDMPNFRLQAFDATTGTVLFVEPTPPALPPVGDFNGPRGVTVDSLGNLYVADTHNFRIEQFDPTGRFVWAVGNRGAAINPDSFAYTRNMAADPSQPYFYIADTYNNAIDKYDSNGTPQWQIAGLGSAPGQFNNPSGVGVAADHNLYVADGHNRRIEIFEPTDGGFLSLFPCAPCTDPRGVAVDPVTGDIYVADSAAALLKFSPTGQYMATIASRGPGVGQLLTASDVVLDSTYLYVTDSKAGMVKLYSLADGSFVTSIGGFKLPSAAAINPVNGHLRVTEEYGDIVSDWCISAC